MCHEQKEARNGVVSERQGLGSSEEDESRIVERTVNVNNGSSATTEVHGSLQLPQQQPQGSMICWERFLPIRSLKVLLVENDDATRHVVSALLRNCSYEVTAVANGLQAWKVLEDLNNHIDIVLTEVAMPILSGIGLLCKIMSHKTFKNIPVIMMSSHDSMSVVFKCLSKGAVDFLVKPIRKNELKNLWQHVWRRCHSSSGSGSESGTQSKKSVNSKSNDEPENYADSSDKHDNESDDLILCDGSENASGTQSSWTKRAAEADSSQPMSSSNQLPDAPDSTCAQAVHVKPEKCGSQSVCVTEIKECREQHEQVGDAAEGKDVEVRVKRNPLLQHGHLATHQASLKQNGLPDAECKQSDSDCGKLEHQNENIICKVRDPNIITAVPYCINQQAESRDSDAPIGPSDIRQVKDGACHASAEILSLELTLKRLHGASADSRNAANDEQNVLRHSDSSAFSKYSTASSANQAPRGNVGSCTPLDHSSVTMKRETEHTFPSHANGILLNQPSIGSSNKNDTTISAKCVGPKPEALDEKSGSISAFKHFHSSSFQPVQNGHVCSSQVLTEKADDTGFKTAHSQSRSSNQVFHVRQCHLHQVEKQQQHRLQADHDTSLKIMAISASQCGSSNVFEGPSDCNVINYSVNGSASGSNYGSNGPNGGSTALNAEQAIIESDNEIAGAMSGRSSSSGADEDRVAQRVAALTKFRQKRKERCFEKRVRYQSRKKLAEQRPRVKGQFVRQIESDSKGGQDCLSNGRTSEDNSSDSVR